MDTVISEKLFLFTQHVTNLLRHECQKIGIPFRRFRFEFQGYLYPLRVITFDHPTRLGYFSHAEYTIGINRIFATKHSDLLIQVIQHELAHLLTYLHHGSSVEPHGNAFHDICKRYGLPAAVARAHVNLLATKQMQSKVQKLLALSESSSKEEGLSALKKAQDLIEKYGLETEDEKEWRMRKLTSQKRASEKLRCIASILQTLAVFPIFSHTRGAVSLEVFGTYYAITIAEEAFLFLDAHLDLLWQKQTALSGASQKKAFFKGIADGYRAKLETDSDALIQTYATVQNAYRTYFGRGSTRIQQATLDSHAHREGRKQGLSLTVSGLTKLLRLSHKS